MNFPVPYLKFSICILFIVLFSRVRGQTDCKPSTNLGVRNLNPLSVEVYWTPGSGKGFWVHYGPKGYGPPGPGPNKGEFTFNNHLSLELNYSRMREKMEFWVKDSCGPDDESSWAGPFIFTSPVRANFHHKPTYRDRKIPCKVLAVGDLNNDFKSDIAVGTVFSSDSVISNKLLLYPQNEDDTITGATFSYSMGKDTIYSLDIADLNDDLLMDLLVGFGDSVSIFLQNNNGGLYRDTTLYSGNRVYDVKCADIDRDGRADFVVYHAGENTIKVFYQNANSSFAPQKFSCSTGSRGELAVADFNGNGLYDLAVMSSAPPLLHVFYNNAQSGIGQPTTYQSSDTTDHMFESMAVGDFLGNGFKDILISRRSQNAAGWIDYWHQDSVGALQYVHQVPTLGQVVNSGDLNCDEYSEVYGILGQVAPNAGPGNSWYLNYFDINGRDLSSSMPGVLTNSSYISPNKIQFHPRSVGHGDFNGDYKPDLAIADTAKGLVIFKNLTDVKPRVISDSALKVRTRTKIDSFSVPVDSFRTKTRDTMQGFYIVKNHRHLLINRYQVTKTITDTFKSEYKAFCGNYFSDTAVYSNVHSDTILLETDTVLEVTEERVPWSYEDYDYHLAVYPNPTNGEVFVKILPVSDNLKVLRIEGFSSEGKWMLSERLEFKEKGIFNFSNSASAIYYIQIEWKGRYFQRAIIKR